MDVGLQLFIAGMFAAAAIAIIMNAIIGRQFDQRGLYKTDDPRWEDGRRQRPH